MIYIDSSSDFINILRILYNNNSIYFMNKFY